MQSLTISVCSHGGSDFNSISEAIKNAGPGDIVVLKAGQYDERVVLDKSITIKGQDAAASEDGSTAAEAGRKSVIIAGGFVSTAEGCGVSNVTIQQGVDIRSGSCKIDQCDIEHGDGVKVGQNTQCSITNSLICGASQLGDGVYFMEGSKGAITECEIRDHRVNGIHLKGAEVDIMKNTIIEAVVVAYGPDFAPFAQSVAQALDPYCSPDRPGEDHVMAMGSLAEIAMRIGEGITPYFDRCLELALSVMENTDELIAKLNSCFMISALAKNAGHRYKPAQVQHVLASLWILLQTCKDLKQNATGGARAGLNNGREGPEAEAEFGGPEDVVRCEDNAVSAVCSLIKANCIPFGGPIEGVLDTVFELVPPRADHREIQNCITALAHLASHHAETIANHPDKANDIAVGFLKCCGKCLCASRVSAEDKTGLGICLTGTVFNGNMGYSQFFKEATNHVSPPRFANALKNIGK